MNAALGHTPAHLPGQLAISLWDFSWYTRAGAGEPFADLDRAFSEAADRGFTTVRICAAPLYLFGEFALPSELEVSGFGPTPAGGYYGERTRWYDVPGGFALQLLERLLTLFARAKDHGMSVILATWEYQQSPSFAASEEWWRAIDAIPLDHRLIALADSWARLLETLIEAGFEQQIAFVELHNEIDFSRVPADSTSVDAAVTALSSNFPGIPVTVSYGRPPHLDMESLPASLQVGQFHIYSYGVLDALQSEIDLRMTGSSGFPNGALRALLLPGAPTWEQYGLPEAWRLEATVITDQMLYGYDWIDPDRWDTWLYDHYALYRAAMRREIEARVVASGNWARRHGVPLVFGEGWVGYTPLNGTFEEGPVGKDLAEYGVELALEQGAWGAVACSNAAPHHPMWADAAWLRRVNRSIVEHG